MKYLFYDLETTGFAEGFEKVIEIAAAVVDMNTGKIIDTFNTFVDPGKPIPEKITQITSITDSMVKGAPTEEMAFRSFSAFIKTHNIDAMGGHNTNAFDLRWLRHRNNNFSLGLDLDIEMFDTLPMVREIAKTGALVGYNFTTPAGRPSFKLENLMKFFELGAQTHRAIDDVLNNVIIYNKLKELETKNTSLGF